MHLVVLYLYEAEPGVIGAVGCAVLLSCWLSLSARFGFRYRVRSARKTVAQALVMLGVAIAAGYVRTFPDV